MVKDVGTEKRIIDAARRVFLKKGMAGARMQEIANEAGINKALLHYYFRSKEKLFESIFEEVIADISGGLKLIFEKEMTVLDRLCSIVDIYIDTLLENKYLPLFVLNEMNNNPERFSGLINEHMVVHLGKLMQQIEEEIESGKIRAIQPPHLLLNVLGLVIFPFATFPVLSKIGGEQLKPILTTFLEDRKTVVKDFIINALTPQVKQL